ncbi:roadblock/LC7 domain-containing protein [Deferribacter autotrophicus]|uniref:Roadblock/LC7 domain-containing protein n=1 Tax=Deferribacter autotrophicus TaxID=500465 RepID=A0A5A8F7Z2_9BACT|nr:roadblock/LC7 domain-containing protein [Deferribacter autotrophicus]KAA0258392.1 roadblock/LC7 domain-containing protein [Deferribacter autotrophicus]
MFKKIIQSIFNSVEGLKLFAIFDKDGIIVDKEEKSERTAEELAAEFSSVLRYIDKVTTYLVTGKMEKMVIDCGNEIFYLHKLNKFYYIVALLDRNAIIGKLRFYIKYFEQDLRRELDID